MKIELAKGVRDFGPEQKLLRQEIVDTLRCVFERYGYAPIETPIIERMDVLSAKFGAGQESDATRETFQFQDQGGRKLGLRFDLTVPFARFVAMNPNLKMPFKRYQIERVYRDGPIKLGRYREFWQCDVDVAGTKSMLADAEMIDIALTSFKDLGLDVVIEFNNRKLLDGMMEFAGITKARRDKAIIVIDKFKKSSKGDLETEWKENGLEEEAFVKLYGILNTQGKNNQETLNLLKEFLSSETSKQGIDETEELLGYLKAMNIKDAILTPSLARGLGYYTGPVYEGFLKDKKLGITSSVCGGGRYDDMVGEYVGGGRVVPATGISFGLEPITEAFKKQRPELKASPTQIYIIPIGTTKQSLGIVKQLRKKGINADIDLNKRGISKNLGYANALGIPFVAFVGEDELKQGKVKLRDMKSGKEKMIAVEDIDFKAF